MVWHSVETHFFDVDMAARGGRGGFGRGRGRGVSSNPNSIQNKLQLTDVDDVANVMSVTKRAGPPPRFPVRIHSSWNKFTWNELI